MTGNYGMAKHKASNPNVYRPFYKFDDELKFFFRDNPARFADARKKFTDGDRLKATEHFSSSVRPRPTFEERSANAVPGGTGLLRPSCWNKSSVQCPPAISTPTYRGGASSSSEKRLVLGDTVKVAGLSGRPDLNGSSAQVLVDVPDKAGRIHVRLAPSSSSPDIGGKQAPAKIMRINVDCLTKLEGSTSIGKSATSGDLGRSPFSESMAWPELQMPTVHHNYRGYGRKKTGQPYSMALGLTR